MCEFFFLILDLCYQSFFPVPSSIFHYILPLFKTAVDQNDFEKQLRFTKHEALPICSQHFCVAWGSDICTNLHFHVMFWIEHSAYGLHNMLYASETVNMLLVLVWLQLAMWCVRSDWHLVFMLSCIYGCYMSECNHSFCLDKRHFFFSS